MEASRSTGRHSPLTGDMYRFRGRSYSDKPPLLALTAVPVALALKHAGITFRRDSPAMYTIVTLLTVGTWFALGVIFVF